MKKLLSKRMYIFLPLGVLLLVGCSKSGEADATPADGSTTLQFDAAMIGDPIEIVEKDNASSSNRASVVVNKALRAAAARTKSEILEVQQVTEGEFDAIASLEESRSGTALSTTNVANKARAGGGLKAETMPSGRRYRVLIYDNNDVYQGTIDATSGTQLTTPFPVFQRTTYKWYAYSYNTTTQVPVPSSTSSPTVAATQGMTDLLYAAGTITTVAGSNKIDIEFERKLAVIKVRLDARGMFSPINSVTGTYSTATTGAVRGAGVLNLKTGAYQSTTASSSSSLTWVNESTATGDSVKMAYIYTTGTSPINGITIALSNIQLKLDNNQNTTRTFTNRNFAFTTAFTPTLGNRYTVNISLLESAVTVGNIQWARANLYHRSADNGYRFRQQSSNIYNTATDPATSGEYWNWRAATPGPSVATNVTDPCAFVFPAGTWRMPTNTELQTLSNVTTNRSWGTTDNPLVRYVAWTNGANNEYGINWTSWISFGYRNQNANTITGYTAGSNYNGYWWSSTPGTTTTANYFRVQYTGTSSGTIAASLTMARNIGMNIRCVRD